jgi:hypothetical protein
VDSRSKSGKTKSLFKPKPKKDRRVSILELVTVFAAFISRATNQGEAGRTKANAHNSVAVF